MMNPADWPGFLVYPGIFLSAAVEGEIVFVTAAILASLGRLNPFGVFVAGALGGSAGDQFYFYAMRMSASGWLSRFVRRIPRNQLISRRIVRRSTPMILACRFLPGLRIAISVTCACAGVPPLQFSALSLIGGFVWSALIVLIINRAGPALFLFKAWWTPVVPAVLILLFFYWLGRASKTRLERSAEVEVA
jgi:membrane-associated protein